MSEPVPVFVDPTGRRARRTRLAGALVAALCFGYLLMVVIALVASPGVLRLAVPGLRGLLPNAAAPPITSGGGSPGGPAAVLTGAPVPRVTPSPLVTTSATPAPAVATNPAGRPLPTQRRGSPVPSVTATSGATATATPSPTAAARRTGKPTAPPGGSGKPAPTRGPRTQSSP